jgi:hypothetical protein
MFLRGFKESISLGTCTEDKSTRRTTGTEVPKYGGTVRPLLPADVPGSTRSTQWALFLSLFRYDGLVMMHALTVPQFTFCIIDQKIISFLVNTPRWKIKRN